MEQIFFLLRHPFQKSSWRHSERHRHTLQTTQSRRRPFPLLGGGRASKAKDRSINNSGSSWGLMASRQTGRYEGRRPMCFPAESLLVSWMWKSRGRQAVFRPGGSLKINRRIHWGLSFLSLRLNEVVCTWCVCMGGRLSGVLLHFNEVLPTPLSCHFDHTVTYELMRMHT